MVVLADDCEQNEIGESWCDIYRDQLEDLLIFPFQTGLKQSELDFHLTLFHARSALRKLEGTPLFSELWVMSNFRNFC